MTLLISAILLIIIFILALCHYPDVNSNFDDDDFNRWYNGDDD